MLLGIRNLRLFRINQRSHEGMNQSNCKVNWPMCCGFIRGGHQRRLLRLAITIKCNGNGGSLTKMLHYFMG